MSNAAEAVNSLGSYKCRCGLLKDNKGVSFCRDCYMSLPKSMRAALRERAGQGYVESYIAACELLDGHAAAGGAG